MKRETDFDDSARLELALKVLNQVKELHDKGLVHGDIKPGNICIDENGCVILMDFESLALQGEIKDKQAESARLKAKVIALAKYDWYVVRQSEKGTAIPEGGY